MQTPKRTQPLRILPLWNHEHQPGTNFEFLSFYESSEIFVLEEIKYLCALLYSAESDLELMKAEALSSLSLSLIFQVNRVSSMGGSLQVTKQFIVLSITNKKLNKGAYKYIVLQQPYEIEVKCIIFLVMHTIFNDARDRARSTVTKFSNVTGINELRLIALHFKDWDKIMKDRTIQTVIWGNRQSKLKEKKNLLAYKPQSVTQTHWEAETSLTLMLVWRFNWLISCSPSKLLHNQLPLTQQATYHKQCWG